jgi:ketosteroid isomerase-like protein
MSTGNSPESALRQRIEGLAQAIRDKSLDVLMSHYAPDVVVYDVYPPLETRGAAGYRANFERWFSSVRGPIDYRMQDLKVIPCGSHSVFRCICHIKASGNDGQPMEYSVRLTSVLESRGANWLVTHEHVSMPAKR